ncbi:hypothetical protein [Blastococcus brunescens]|uniref:Uncharacterized protein n=1 Tax=Blastococcus brunescens TaxID=1564165 RepID=A0ABZ1B0G1_9ACTN|nr:hypothetical protein [Blastococcus sp. BMG 8361]WRL62515.1 hypothetical protein U6N30_21290 [Blastococcus sp. BMG 8361]
MSTSHGTQRTDPATARLAGWIEPVVGAAGYDLEELVVTPQGGAASSGSSSTGTMA